MQQSNISYALKPVLPAPKSIRPSQTKAMEKIDTAAVLYFILKINFCRVH